MYHELNISYKFNGDQNMNDMENKITEFANMFNYLNDVTYALYKPSVDMYIAQLKNEENVSENELCLFWTICQIFVVMIECQDFIKNC